MEFTKVIDFKEQFREGCTSPLRLKIFLRTFQQCQICHRLMDRVLFVKPKHEYGPGTGNFSFIFDRLKMILLVLLLPLGSVLKRVRELHALITNTFENWKLGFILLID